MSTFLDGKASRGLQVVSSSLAFGGRTVENQVRPGQPSGFLVWLFLIFSVQWVGIPVQVMGLDQPPSLEPVESVNQHVRRLVQEKKREEALTFLINSSQKAKGFAQADLIQKVRIASKQFITNQTFQIYQDGLNFLLAKKYGAAREKFERANSGEPDNAEILLRLGQCLVLDNSPKEALSYLKAAAKLNPFDMESHLWLGRAFQMKGQFTDAIQELRIAHRGLPTSELAPVWLAEAIFSSGQFHQALKTLERDVRAHPFHLMSLLAEAKFRIQIPRPESQSLWSARKCLQLALSRLEYYSSQSQVSVHGEFNLDLRNSKTIVKSEIQKLLQQVQNRLDHLTPSSAT